MATEYISLREGREASGLRLVVLRGVPSPWTQAAKGIFHVKALPHRLVQRTPDDPPELLREWTGQSSFPVVANEDEPTRSGWAEILLLAERLAPEPALIPSDPRERAFFFGLCHEICGEMGLGWCRRLEGIDAGAKGEKPNPMAAYLGPKYGYYPETAARAPWRVVEILTLLRDQLAEQRDAGRPYFMGDDLSALDIYWAVFSNLLKPLPPEQCALPDSLRPMFTSTNPLALALLDEGLLDHRDLVFEKWLGLPMEL